MRLSPYVLIISDIYKIAVRKSRVRKESKKIKSRRVLSPALKIFFNNYVFSNVPSKWAHDVISILKQRQCLLGVSSHQSRKYVKKLHRNAVAGQRWNDVRAQFLPRLRRSDVTGHVKITSKIHYNNTSKLRCRATSHSDENEVVATLHFGRNDVAYYVDIRLQVGRQRSYVAFWSKWRHSHVISWSKIELLSTDWNCFMICIYVIKEFLVSSYWNFLHVMRKTK